MYLHVGNKEQHHYTVSMEAGLWGSLACRSGLNALMKWRTRQVVLIIEKRIVWAIDIKTPIYQTYFKSLAIFLQDIFLTYFTPNFIILINWVYSRSIDWCPVMSPWGVTGDGDDSVTTDAGGGGESTWDMTLYSYWIKFKDVLFT